MQSSQELTIKFEGADLEEGVINIYDLATTIISFGKSMEAIAKNERITAQNKLNIDVSALKPGSFEVHFLLSIHQQIDPDQLMLVGTVGALITSQETMDYAKRIIDIFKGVIKVKKFLSGEKPKEIKIEQNGNNAQATVYNFHGDNMKISMPVYNALQDKHISQSIRDMIEPVKKVESNVQSMSIEDNVEKLEVRQEEAPFFDRVEELQTVSEYSLKGIVSAFDRKTGNGKITVGSDRRISFELNNRFISIDVLNQNEIFLIDSLKMKVPATIKGEATLDFDGNIKKIYITSVDLQAKLEIN